MKNKLISLYCITLCIFCQALAFSTPVSAVNTNDFYFENATFDYYLDKNTTTGTKMIVRETLTAVFPDTDQNHGITRKIPFTNQSGKNRTIKDLNLKVLRNGKPEPFTYNEYSDDGYYYVKIGSADTYVHGTQTYSLTYSFENVVTNFNKNGKLTHDEAKTVFQELYWDTNGTGWSQKFHDLTATVHLPNEALFKTIPDQDISCYIGTQKSTDQSRCEIVSDPAASTLTFTTHNLDAGENLTFAIKFSNAPFPTVAVHYNYSIVIFIVIIILYWLIIIFIRYQKYTSLRKLYKNTPTVPQYTPLKEISPAEAAKLLVKIKPKGSPEVATLINLAVNHKIRLKKGNKKVFGGYNWEVEIVSTSHLTIQEQSVLKIINNASNVNTGDVIKIKNHPYKSSLAKLSNTFRDNIEKNLKNKNFIKNADVSYPTRLLALVAFSGIASFSISVLIIVSTILSDDAPHSILVGEKYIQLLPTILFVFPISSYVVISKLEKKFKDKTEEGVKIARYYDGLYYYMKLAESERIKFLQSVDNVDTSPQGIVNLYEKLLPYAIIFGIENSWMNELNKYYVLEDITNSAWFDGATLSLYDINNFNHYVSASIASGIADRSSLDSNSGSGSDWSSSSDSGSSGGGFSGGGGGGGGGGGW